MKWIKFAKQERLLFLTFESCDFEKMSMNTVSIYGSQRILE